MCIKRYLLSVAIAFLLWIWPEAVGFALFAMLAPPLCDSSCCQSCTIFTDDFSTDRIATDYTTVSGTITIFSGAAVTATNGIVVSNTSGTTGHGRVTLKGKASSTGGTFRAIGSYVNSTTYVYAEVTINGASSTLKLWNKATSTQIGSTYTFTASTSTYYTIELCWRGTSATASIVGDTASEVYGAYSGTGNKAGFGGTAGGLISIDDFTFSKSHIDDASCATCGNGETASTTCTGCISGTAPAGGFDMSVTGITNDGCANCTTIFNGLHICDQYADISIGGGTGCRWYYNSSSPTICCDAANVTPILNEIRIYLDSGTGHYYLDVVMEHCTSFGVVQIATFQYDFGTTQPDCRDISGLVIPYSGQTGSATACVFSGATVTVTANV